MANPECYYYQDDVDANTNANADTDTTADADASDEYLACVKTCSAALTKIFDHLSNSAGFGEIDDSDSVSATLPPLDYEVVREEIGSWYHGMERLRALIESEQDFVAFGGDEQEKLESLVAINDDMEMEESDDDENNENNDSTTKKRKLEEYQQQQQPPQHQIVRFFPLVFPKASPAEPMSKWARFCLYLTRVEVALRSATPPNLSRLRLMWMDELGSLSIESLSGGGDAHEEGVTKRLDLVKRVVAAGMKISGNNLSGLAPDDPENNEKWKFEVALANLSCLLRDS